MPEKSICPFFNYKQWHSQKFTKGRILNNNFEIPNFFYTNLVHILSQKVTPGLYWLSVDNMYVNLHIFLSSVINYTTK